MKKSKLQPLLRTFLFLIALFSYTLSYGRFNVNGIWYERNSDGKTASVVYEYYNSSNNYLGLQNAIIPDTVSYNGLSYRVTKISSMAFASCASLTNLSIPNSVGSIESVAFYGCIGLTNIEIPKSVNTIGNAAFGACYNITKLTWNAYYCNSNGEMPTSRITEAKIGSGVIVLPSNFISGSQVSSIDIPNSVTTICENAFHNCSRLTSITIPNSVISIGEDAFSGCTELTELTWNPKNCTTMGDMPKSKISLVKIGSEVETLPSSFVSGSSITSVVIPESLTNIENTVFRSCKELRTISVANGNPIYDSRNNCNGIIETANNKLIVGCQGTTIPNNVISIADFAFYESGGLEHFDIPSSVLSIGQYAFYGCTGLRYLDLEFVTTIKDNAFNGCSSVAAIRIGESASAIGDNAFLGCAPKVLIWSVKNCSSNGNMTTSSLEGVSIGSSVETIPKNFAKGSKITEVTIPNSVTEIGEYAFYRCNGLNVITIGESVSSINVNAFTYCNPTYLIWNAKSCSSNGSMTTSSLEGVSIGSSVETLPENFAKGSKITEVTIPNSVIAIGKDAFYGCSGLTGVTIGTSVTTIGNSAFCDCSGLTSVTIPNSVTSIGNSAFLRCKGLKSVIIGNSVNSIGVSAFSECKDLASVDIPNSVNAIGDAAFDYCTSLTNLTIGTGVTSIGEYAFESCYGLTSVTIPNSVTTINEGVFALCYGLTSLTIPNSVIFIGKRAFYGCGGLSSVTLGNSVTTIGDEAFSYCSGLKSMVIGNSVTSIGGGAFGNCSSLMSVIIGDAVTSIGKWAFYGCSSLETLDYNAISCSDFNYSRSDHPFYDSNITTINIGNKVEKIPAYFANGMSKLTTVTIGTGVTSIGDQAFQGCSELDTLNFNAVSCSDFSFNSYRAIYPPFYDLNISTINIGNSVKSIPAYFVYGLTKVSELTIPNSVIYIGYDAFWGCAPSTLTWNAKNCTSLGNLSTSNITQVKIGSTVEVLPSDFVSGSKITSVNLPNSLTAISDYAFSNCSALTSVSIPNSVTTIYQNAFSNCVNMTDVAIGNSVNTIYRSAFAGCKKLMYVSCKAIMPPKYDENDNYYVLFDDIAYQKAILYVPDLTYGYYKQSDPWNKFMEIKTEPYSDSGVAFDAKVYPTSVRMDAGDENEECYFTFDNKQYQPLLVTGLEPNNIYSATYTRDWGADIPLKFYTSELKMVPEGGKMLNETAAQLMAETNMADEETMCGFDWRRLEGPDDYLGTRAYCPVYDGKMAGTLKNLSQDTWYKFRPFYKSNAGNVYYGDWVTFYSGDWGVEFDPVVYTYNSPAVSQTDATLQGVALRGSSEITEQGFEYWKSGTSNVKKVTASGERMSATVNGLDPETSYKFRAFVTADGKTVRGADVEFATRMGEHHVDNSLDVNADGVVNIADMNVVINVILKGSNDNKCDVNGDGLVNISDLNAIISAILAN